jgi:hypothetical protein
MSQQNIKQIIQQQYAMCAKDPVFFMRQYCYIQHPKKGKIKFNLFPFQESSLTELRDNRYNVILKSRQLGISTLKQTINYLLNLKMVRKSKQYHLQQLVHVLKHYHC